MQRDRLNAYEWRRWFAWRPVRVAGHWRWLCWLERRAEYRSSGMFWEVRDI